MRILDNVDCDCITVDPGKLAAALGRVPDVAPLVAAMPHLFSASPVFIAPRHVAAMEAVVAAVHAAAASPAFAAAALAGAPETARADTGPLGAFYGFDFHLGAAGPALIEINTNAGGAMLNVVLAEAQRACCDEVRPLMNGPVAAGALPGAFVAMFQDEFRAARGDRPLATIAIVDDAPERQFLYPEFLLFRRLFEQAGLRAVVADAASLTFDGAALRAGGQSIDLVYNRLTDFYLEEPAHAALRDAYLAGAAVVTPNPRNYALFADKRNLVRLTDGAFLQAAGVPAPAREALARGIPPTELVTSESAERLWRERRGYFFKPVSGYGSKAAYRGDKLTKGTWAEILARAYVAQRLVPPSERKLRVAGADAVLKLDVRAYVYAGKTQLLAARLYQGQTTNFRTPGGGFAPVFTGPSLEEAAR